MLDWPFGNNLIQFYKEPRARQPGGSATGRRRLSRSALSYSSACNFVGAIVNLRIRRPSGSAFPVHSCAFFWYAAVLFSFGGA
jgi:hypothetical protein